MSGSDFPTDRPGGWPDAETAAAASRLGQLLRCRHEQTTRCCPVCTPDTRPGAAPAVVTLCGSMRFFTQILAVASQETAAGAIVLAPFTVVAPAAQSSIEGQALKARLDELHRHKIDLADLVIVVSDASGYYGASTTGEISYAHAAGSPVSYRRITTTEYPEAGQ